MVKYCCAFGCKEKASKESKLTFHSFPKDEERRKLWTSKIGRENFQPTDHDRICSKHFTPDSFDTEKFGGTWLKKTAVPTLFDFPSHSKPKIAENDNLGKRSTEDLTPNPEPISHVKVVRALYPYTAQQADELSFEEGDNLYILDVKSNANWWKASCQGKVGLIPSNYVEESTEEVMHPLHEAAKRGNITFLTECLKNKVSVNGLDKAGCTALHWASHAGNEDCVRELLKVANIEINVQNKLGDTPLHSCAWKGHSEIVKMLLEKGAISTLKNNENKTPFSITNDPACAALLKPLERTSSLIAAEEYIDSEDSD